MNAQPLDWNDLRFVLAVCHEGSLSGAARRLNVNHSTVFRRINAVEEMLGVRLFERLSNGYAMTEAGEAVLQTGERIENEVLGLSHKLIGKDLRLSGVLKVTAPDALAVKILMPHLTAFSKRYPEIQLELSVASNYFNLTQREADIAVRATNTPPDTLIGHRVCRLATTIYGSTAYLANHLEKSCEQFAWLMPNDELTNLPVSQWKKSVYPRANIVFRSNSFLALFEATKKGQGVSPLPCFLGDPDLDRIIAPPEELVSELWLLSHPDLRQTARVRAFTEFLTAALKQDSNVLEGIAL